MSNRYSYPLNVCDLFMATKKKRKEMVLREEGAAAPATASAATHPPACFVVLKPGKASKGGIEEGILVTDKEADMIAKSNVYSAKEIIKVSATLPVMEHPATAVLQPDNLLPDSTCKGIQVTLDNNSMWNEFFRCQTEMILTKQGSRMFPYCRFRISGLEPSKNYSLIMDIQPVDNSCYQWTGQNWQVAGKAERHVKSQPFAHPESPSSGQYWMQNPVSFYKLKLTNNISDQEGNIFLHAFHRYLPRLHVIPSEKGAKDIKLNRPHVVTFTFPQTEFFAVTAYQNSRFAQLKVDCNPFAKGLKEDGSSSWALKLKATTSKDSHKEEGTTSNQEHPVKRNLKSLLASHKPRSSKTVDQKQLTSDALKTVPTEKEQSAAKAIGETSCNNARPAQKLFSELIREAHVSLKRCNLEQMCVNNSTICKVEQTDTKSLAIKSKAKDAAENVSLSSKTPSESSSAKAGENSMTKNNVLRSSEEDKHPLTIRDPVLTAVSDKSAVAKTSLNSSVNSDCTSKPEAQPKENVKPHKRPAPVPLPALARFLQQHRQKPRKVRIRPESPSVLPSESEQMPPPSAVAPASLANNHPNQPTDPSKDPSGKITKPGSQSSSCTGSDPHPFGLNIISEAAESDGQASRPSTQAAVSTPDHWEPRTDYPVSVPEPFISDGAPVLQNSDQLFYTQSTISSPTTSSACPMLSPPLDTVLTYPCPTQTTTSTDSTRMSPNTIKPAPVLPDSEGSPFGFEPLSPANSPEPLPSLPGSLALELYTSPVLPTSKVVPPGQVSISEDSAMSTLKWHTVLPLPDPFLTSFTSFQPTPTPPSLFSTAPPLLDTQTPRPSLSPSHPGPQALGTSISSPSSDPATSFQDNDQSLPFPEELSPLAFHLSLSPTFSSLDGDALSPTPSLTDLMHIISTDDNLEMEVDFSNTEAVSVTCPPLGMITANKQGPSQQAQPPPANKTLKCKKKSRQAQTARTDLALNKVDSTYTSKQPNLEEVEEQLFVSFTSKEALNLHVGGPSEGQGITAKPQRSSVTQTQQTTEATKNVETPESLEERIVAFETVLLRDLKLMKHRQVIHPVLQEVGLKLSLLDPKLAIDLQYLGVRLPIPPPGVSLEPLSEALAPVQSVSAAFVSRTGKTTDFTQIKGWRDKFAPSESSSAPSSSKPEAGPSSDVPSRNLSAFCSDMLDEYLENEGRLIDERAASFSQATLEPVSYELPTRSTSYVRTLDSILKKQTQASPTSALISSFVPPSKRPKPSAMGPKKSKGEKRQNAIGSKQNKLGTTVSTVSVPTANNLTPPSEQKAPITKAQHDPVLRFKSNKLKTKASCQTPGPFPSKTAQLGVSKDLAPLDSDSELGTAAEPSDRTVPRPDAKPLVTKALLKQKDLEDGVVWEGRPKTCITAERAAIALTSLFTLVGFVREDPTAPIQVIRRRAPPCLNDFCRLGCVCASLNHTRRVTHCGKTRCMFGCSCLRQKVVLLKNLEGPDSSPSDQGKSKKRKKKKRMKMAYILKEAESVAQPAQWVRTLWRTGSGDRDPEPIHAPQPCRLPGTAESDLDMMSCARVRGYGGRKTRLRNHNPTTEKESSGHSTDGKLKPTSTDVPPKKAKLKSSHPPADPCQSPAQPNPTPSKRLVIIADCRWSSSVVQTYVLKKICEAMAQDLLNNSFWVKNYFITPLCQERMGDGCIYYKVHISEGKLDPSTGTMVPLTKPPDQDKQQETGDQETVERQGEKEEEEEGVEDWQREVEEDDLLNMEEAEGREKTGEQIQVETEKMRMMKMGLPFLTGTSAAGFLSANIKQPGGTNLLVQVNGKPYPLAKIQLGKMGALHPANRLAAYLTGRVRSSRPQQAPSPASSSSHPPQKPADSQSSALAPPDHRSAVSMSPSVASTPTTTKPKVTMSSYPPGSVEPKAAVTQVTTSVVSPLNQSLGNVGHNIPQVLVPLSGTSRPPQSVGSEPRRMVLQTVRTQSGQLYQKLDGKLVQLVPLSQLRAVNPGLVVQRAPSVVQGNVVTQPSAASLAPPPASLSGLQTFSVPPLPLSQQGTCTLQIIPAGNREPLTVTCPKVPSKTRVATASTSFTLLRPSCPAQNALISLQTPGSQGAEPGVKTLSVSAGRAAAGRVVDLSRLIPHPQTKAQSQPTTTQNQAGTSSRAPAQPAATQLGSVTQPSSCPSIDLSAITSPELALHTDLDIITVTDETENHPGKPPVDRAKGSRDGPSLDRREKKKEKGEVVVLVESSDEADGSSDIMDDSDNNSVPDLAEHISKSIHNALERNRRMKLTECFDGLRKELGLTNEKTPKITILNKAQQEVQTLRRTRRTLERQRRSLRKERTERIITISQMSGKTADVIYSDVQRLSKTQESAQSDSSDHSSGTPSDNLLLGGAGSEPPLVADEMEVVDLLEETDEQTDHSSDEENVITNKNIITINSDDDVSDVESVDIETVDECSLFSLAERKLAAVRKSLDLDPSLREKGAAARTEAGFQALSLVMNVQTGSKRFLLQQACREIHTLQDQGETLERLRSGLSHQRTSYIREISIRSGKSEECILKKLQHLSAKQRRLEQETHSATTAQPPGGSAAKQPPPGGSAAEQPPPGGSAAEQPPPGGSAAEQPLRDTNRHSALSMAQPKSLPQTPLPQPQVQPTPWAGPLLQPQAQQAAQPAQQSHTSGHGVGVVQSATLDASSLSHNAPGFRDKPKTIPNILSHRKQPSVHSEPVQALVPGEVLTLLGATLPRQQILHLSPLATGPTFLHTSPTPGVASVTLNISNLANQQIPVSSLSRPPLGKVYSTTALLTAPATNLTACSFPTMLHLVHSQPEQPLPQTQQHQQTPTQQPEPHQPTQPQQTQQAVSSGAAVVRMLSEPLTKTQEVPTLASTQTQNQVHSPGTPVLSGPSPQGTSPSPQQSAGAVAWHPASPPPREEEEEEAKMNLSSSRCREVSTAPEEVKVKEEVGEGSDGESLTSLLNEIVFLNQQVCGADGVTLSTLPRKPSSEPGPSTLTGAPLGMESMGGAQEEGEVGGGMDKSCSLSPLFLELDEDPIESSTENTVVLNGHNQTGPASGADSSTSPATNRQSQLHNPQCTAKGGTLTPPPLLQMKVGRVGDRAKTVESTNERAEGQESGLQWRPMPRLVPLGLKNNAQPSV